MVHCHRKDNWSPFENWFLLCFVLFRFLLRESFMATPPCRQRRIPLSWALLIMLSYSRPSVRCPKTHMKNPREFVLLKTTEFSFIFPVGNKLTNLSFLTLSPREAGNPNAELCAKGGNMILGLLSTHGSPVLAAPWIFVGICPKLCCSDMGNSMWFCWANDSISNWYLPLLAATWGPADVCTWGKSIT